MSDYLPPRCQPANVMRTFDDGHHIIIDLGTARVADVADEDEKYVFAHMYVTYIFMIFTYKNISYIHYIFV